MQNIIFLILNRWSTDRLTLPTKFPLFQTENFKKHKFKLVVYFFFKISWIQGSTFYLDSNRNIKKILTKSSRKVGAKFLLEPEDDSTQIKIRRFRQIIRICLHASNNLYQKWKKKQCLKFLQKLKVYNECIWLPSI